MDVKMRKKLSDQRKLSREEFEMISNLARYPRMVYSDFMLEKLKGFSAVSDQCSADYSKVLVDLFSEDDYALKSK